VPLPSVHFPILVPAYNADVYLQPSVVCGQDSKGNKVCADSKSVILPSVVCGQDSKGNKVCADSKSVILPSVVCGQDSKGNRVCANSQKRDVEARLLKVCGQDSKGNKVCAEKREVEVEARLLKVCGKDSKGNVVCAEKREELDARSITVSALPLLDVPMILILVPSPRRCAARIPRAMSSALIPRLSRPRFAVKTRRATRSAPTRSVKSKPVPLRSVHLAILVPLHNTHIIHSRRRSAARTPRVTRSALRSALRRSRPVSSRCAARTRRATRSALRSARSSLSAASS
jgi:hypothetical protein